MEAIKDITIFDYLKQNFYLTKNLTLIPKDFLNTNSTSTSNSKSTSTSYTTTKLTTKLLCEVLSIQPGTYSRMNSGKLQIGPALIIRIHEASNLSIAVIKGILH